jgi:hypothetical protein
MAQIYLKYYLLGSKKGTVALPTLAFSLFQSRKKSVKDSNKF